MVLLPGVDVLHIALVIDQVREGADKVPAGAEHLKHGPPLPIERQPVVELHLPRQPGVVTGDPVEKMGASLHHGGNALAPALIKDGGVGHPQNGVALEHRVVLLCLPDPPCLFHRIDAQALVGAARTAVQLLDAVKPALLIRRVPPHRERLRETEIVPPVDLPVSGDGKGRNDMGPALVLIMPRVVPPLGEHLPAEAVPAAIEQGLLFRFGQACQTGKVVRVIFQQSGVVEHAGRDKHPCPLQHLLGSVRHPHRELLHDGGAGRGRRDEPGFHPAVPHTAGIGGGPQVDPGARAGRAVAAHHIAVLFPLEMGQLIEPDEVEGLALIICAVLGVLHGTKVDLCPAGEHPHMAGGVVLRRGKSPLVVGHALVHQITELGVGLAQDEPPIVGDVHLPQGLDHQRVTLAAACRAPVQGFWFRAAHELRLPGLGPPYDLCIHTSSTAGRSTTPHARASASAP